MDADAVSRGASEASDMAGLSCVSGSLPTRLANGRLGEGGESVAFLALNTEQVTRNPSN